MIVKSIIKSSFIFFQILLIGALLTQAVSAQSSCAVSFVNVTNIITNPDNNPACGVDARGNGNSIRVYFPGCENEYNYPVGPGTAYPNSGNYCTGELEDGGGSLWDRKICFFVQIVCAPPWMHLRGATSYSTQGFANRRISGGNLSLTGSRTAQAYLSNTTVLKQSGPFTENGRVSQINSSDQSYALNSSVLDFSSIISRSYLYAQTLRNEYSFSTKGNTAINGNFSDSLSEAQGNLTVQTINGNLTISEGSTCNIKGIFFVNGNLTINSTLNVGASNDGCLFFVNGNVSIGAPSSTAIQNFQEIHAFILASGNVNIANDSYSRARSVYIRGTLIANQVNNNRDPQGFNSQRAAFNVEYDPRYKVIFSKIFANNEYSIREKID
jgi:hypothetical protein